MKNTKPTFELDQALPKELFDTSSARFVSYRGFPVFSRPWVVRRTLWVTFWVSLPSLWIFLGRDIVGISSEYIILYAVSTVLSFCFAPVVAYFGRRRYLNTPQEWARTLQALGAGILVAVLMSLYFEQKLGELHPMVSQDAQTQTSATQPAPKNKFEHQKPKDPLGHLVFTTVLIALFGGGYAGLAYNHERNRIAELTEKRAFEALRAEKLDVDSKLAVLQAQVEPHFLFNSLASVRALVKSDPDRAHASIDALVEYLRATIPQMRTAHGAQSFSTVAQQIHLSQAYLEVMIHRMGERLNVIIDLPEALNQTPFPPLLLLSLVENAIKHGAEPNLDRTTITISVGTLDEKQLFVRVADDGAGLVPQAISGIGLANVRAQLAARFGDAARFELRHGGDASNPKGVVAEITVPIE